MSKRSDILGEGAIWAGAAALIVALHFGGGIWIAHRAAAMAPPGLPEAIHIDLAPPPPAEEVAAAPPEEEAAEEPVEEAQPEPEPEPEPEPQPEPDVVEEIKLPELPQLAPIEDFASLIPQMDSPSALALTSSVAPQRRPERREPEPRRETEPQRERQREPEPRRQAQPQQQQQSQQPARQQRAAPQGNPGPSAQQVANMQAQWGAQVETCISRQVRRVNARSPGSVTINIVVARNGRIQGVGLAGSSGDARTDQAIARAAQRARCPAAPRGYPNASASFQQPVTIGR